MKILIPVLILLALSGISSPNKITPNHEVVKREFEIGNATAITFVQDIFFNTVGELLPLGWFLNAVINLFQSGQSQPSLIDQIREEVQKGVTKGITNFYGEFLVTEVTII